MCLVSWIRLRLSFLPRFSSSRGFIPCECQHPWFSSPWWLFFSKFYMRSPVGLSNLKRITAFVKMLSSVPIALKSSLERLRILARWLQSRRFITGSKLQQLQYCHLPDAVWSVEVIMPKDFSN
jgi:hypothetical protein